MRYKRLQFIISFGILFFFSYITNNVFSESKPLIRELKVYEGDSIFKYTYYYDDFRNKVMENKYFVKNNASLPLSRTEWIYEDTMCVLQRHSKWEATEWQVNYLISTEYIENSRKYKEKYTKVDDNIETVEKTIVNTYDNNGLLSSEETYQGDDIEKLKIQEIKYNYNESGKLKENKLTGKKNQEKELATEFRYVYDESGRIDSLITMDETDQKLTNSQLYTFYYQGSSDVPVLQFQKKWNDQSELWENQTKTEFFYNEYGQLSDEIYSYYNVLFWSPDVRYEYIYDKNVLASKIMYRLMYRQWRKIYTIEYKDIKYDQPNLMESRWDFWGGTTDEYVSNYIPFYFNDEISIMDASRIEISYILDTNVVTNSNIHNDQLKIYPNPSDGVFYISTQNFLIKSWEVYGSDGTVIRKETNDFMTGVIDISQMPVGLYYIKVFTDSGQQLVKKIIINK